MLHRLRISTYGGEYRTSTQCPYCLSTNEDTIDLGDLEVNEYTDEVQVRAKDYNKKRSNKKGDSALLFTVQFLIDTVDGEKLDPVRKEEFVENLPMMDVNYIMAHSTKLNEKVGLNTDLTVMCDVCGLEYHTTFREGSEFFRPTIDI